ncbi:MAG: hypothetical protein IPK16_06980 [Anaerolineales bacterium]|nr:hypothetical protein [Anaerolineales bacterium]
MGFVQRNLPAILAVVALVLAVLGVFGYFQTQQEVSWRDFTLLTDEEGSGYYHIAEKFKELLAPRGWTCRYNRQRVQRRLCRSCVQAKPAWLCCQVFDCTTRSHGVFFTWRPF